MKVKFAVLIAVAVAALSACGVSPKKEPPKAISQAATIPCTLQQEQDNNGVVTYCYYSYGNTECPAFLDAFISRYPNLNCVATMPNPLAGGAKVISVSYVQQLKISLGL